MTKERFEILFEAIIGAVSDSESPKMALVRINELYWDYVKECNKDCGCLRCQ